MRSIWNMHYAFMFYNRLGLLQSVLAGGSLTDFDNIRLGGLPTSAAHTCLICQANHGRCPGVCVRRFATNCLVIRNRVSGVLCNKPPYLQPLQFVYHLAQNIEPALPELRRADINACI